MPAAPLCPRCGYDLTGLVASWIEACPLTTRCTECGLEFSCGNVLSPRLLGPGWSYEHTLEPRADRFWRTSWAALWPWSLTSQLSVDHAIRPRRAARFAVRWLLGMHLVMLVVTGASWLMDNSMGLGWLDHWLGTVFLDPGPLLGWFVAPYAHEVMVPTGRGTSVRFPVLPPFLISMALTLLMPAWMAILGDTFAAAKVRRIHLVRGLAYSIPGAVSWSLLAVGLTIAGILVVASAPTAAFVMPAAAMALVLVFPLYHLLWWYFFMRRYLRLRHAALTVVLFTGMSALVLIIGVLYYQTRRMWW
jgi:hypothetical protein